MDSLTTTIESLMKNHWDFQQKFKQRLVREYVINPFKFIAGLLTEGVLEDSSTDSDAVNDLKEMMVQLSVKIASSKGAVGVGGLMKALEGSGNSQLVRALRCWAKEDFGVEIYGELREPTEGASAVLFLPTKQLAKNVKCSTQLNSIGRKLLDNITSRVEDNFMEQLQGHLVGKASEIAHAAEFRISLAHHNVLEATDTLLATGSEVQDLKLIEKAIKAACSMKAIGTLVLALESSSNERILVETYDWLQTSEVRKKNYPISVRSLAREQRPTATGLFAATDKGLVSLDLKTLQATGLTSECTRAVAVNQKLKKVYWTEGVGNSSIMRSNFDGSDKEVVVPQAGDIINMLAIDKPTGNVYFALLESHEIKFCSPLGKNCDVVIFSSSLVNQPTSIALDSVKGLMYWSNCPNSGCHSLVRAHLDGSNATIISTGFNDLKNITLDQPFNDVLHWADYRAKTIGTVEVSSGNKRTLLQLQEGNSGPWGVQVDATKIYFSSYTGKNIQSVDRDSGKELTTVFNATGIVRHVALLS